jgi:hypothetical protein
MNRGACGEPLGRVRFGTGMPRKLVAALCCGQFLFCFLLHGDSFEERSSLGNGTLPTTSFNMHPPEEAVNRVKSDIAGVEELLYRWRAATAADLSEDEQEEAKERTFVTAYVVHETIRLEG